MTPRLAALCAVLVTALASTQWSCGGAMASGPDTTSEAAAHRPLPELPTAGPLWQELHTLSQRPLTVANDCEGALAIADQWWLKTRSETQELFVEGEAPDEETIREWTVARRYFFETYLSSPVPVFVLIGGDLRLTAPVRDITLAWAACAADDDAARLWELRSVAP